MRIFVYNNDDEFVGIITADDNKMHTVYEHELVVDIVRGFTDSNIDPIFSGQTRTGLYLRNVRESKRARFTIVDTHGSSLYLDALGFIHVDTDYLRSNTWELRDLIDLDEALGEDNSRRGLKAQYEKRMSQFCDFAQLHYPIEFDNEMPQRLLEVLLTGSQDVVERTPTFQIYSNQCFRALEALFTTNEQRIARARLDQCALVRAAASLNDDNSIENEFSEVLKERRWLGCECVSGAHALMQTFTSAELAMSEDWSGMPLHQHGAWSWSTYPQPNSFADYRMDAQVLDYLKGPVPDHVSISHAGHGINSYSLNIRFAVGNIACIAQVGYGGVYDDSSAGPAQWNSVFVQLKRLYDVCAALDTQARAQGDPATLRQRSYLVQFSDFRGICDVERFVDGVWTSLPEPVESLDDEEFYRDPAAALTRLLRNFAGTLLFADVVSAEKPDETLHHESLLD